MEQLEIIEACAMIMKEDFRIVATQEAA